MTSYIIFLVLLFIWWLYWIWFPSLVLEQPHLLLLCPVMCIKCQFFSVHFRSVAQLCPTLRPHGLQHNRLPCPSPNPRVYSNPSLLSWWCHPTTSSCHPLLLPSIVPSIRAFSNESVLCIRWPKYWSFSFSTCPSSEYSGLISFRTDWFDLPSPTPQFKSINSSVLSFLYSPTLTSIQDYWKKHSFD